MRIRNISSGEKVPDEINVLIEVTKGSQNKYEFDLKKDIIFLDRVLYSSIHYPGDYGHVPLTLCEDGDPLDVLVLVTEPTFPGCLIKVRPIGGIKTIDEEGIDNKIIAVPVNDPRFDHMQDIQDIPKHYLADIEDFFQLYKHLEPNKWVKVKGWASSSEAKKLILHAVNKFKKQG